MTPERIRVSEEPGGSWWQATVQVAAVQRVGAGRCLLLRQGCCGEESGLAGGRATLQVDGKQQMDG